MTNEPTVYAVWLETEHSEPSVTACFSTRERADAFVAALLASYPDGVTAEVVAVPLDPAVPPSWQAQATRA